MQTRVILIPGWNEGADGMQVLVDGRRGRPGLAALGFACTIFDGGKGSLTDRIDQFSQFLAGLRSANPDEGPVALFGYSAGGLIARGLLRAYPDSPVSAIFQLAAPNSGLVTDEPRNLLQRFHFSRSVIEDLDVESPFMSWLNQTGGHWEPNENARPRRWRLDKKPWVAPANVPILNLVGRVPRYRNQSDGIVLVESATLSDAVPHVFVDGRNANHLNLSGTWNPLTLVLRGWRPDDRLWPLAVAAAARLFGGETTPPGEGPAPLSP
jgi:pimeloyl-ACP methyl ester carboxylesterase